MGRRIEVELTSTREDGSWTWRAAGAKQPKGDVMGSLLHEGAQVGDVVKVDAEFHLDGIEITEVYAPKLKKARTDLLELKVRELRDDELITTQQVRRDDRRGDRRGRRGDRNRDDRGRRGDRRPPRQEVERRPKPKRLRPKRAHREALLQSVTEEHRPIVEQVIKDGMPGVRAAIDRQNAEAREAGKPEIDASPIIAIAEKNLGQARLAEWRDRADAALADATDLDIRDLRSVVVAGDDIARDDESRAIVDQIRTVLNDRLESDHTTWLSDLEAAVKDGRVVRGLRLSSRPVKAGAPLPPEMASKLAQQAAEALAPDVGQERWATVLDALAFSPVRGAVTPVGVPPQTSDELMAEVRRLSDRIPTIAALFGVDPAQVPKSAKRRRSPRKGQKGGQGRGDARGRGNNRPENDRPVPGAEPKPAPEEAPAAEATSVEWSEATEVDRQPTVEAAEAAPSEQDAKEADAPTRTDEHQAPTAEADAPTRTDEHQAPTAEADAPTRTDEHQAPTAEADAPTRTDEHQAPTAEADAPTRTDEHQAPTAEADAPTPEPEASAATAAEGSTPRPDARAEEPAPAPAPETGMPADTTEPMTEEPAPQADPTTEVLDSRLDRADASAPTDASDDGGDGSAGADLSPEAGAVEEQV